jgi:hypothetical protein
MKTLIIILIVMLVLFSAFQIYLAMADTTETQTYQVIKTEKEYEIRYYPESTMAMIQSTSNTYKDLASPGFRKLAGYIFGGNESGQSIAMTTPVHMDIQSDTSTMAFVMPSAYSMENLPQPNDSTVKIMKSKAEYVAAIRFGGYASDEDIKKHSDKLRKALEDAGIQHDGRFRFLGYNAPYQVVGRRNEIIVGLVWEKE